MIVHLRHRVHVGPSGLEMLHQLLHQLLGAGEALLGRRDVLEYRSSDNLGYFFAEDFAGSGEDFPMSASAP